MSADEGISRPESSLSVQMEHSDLKLKSEQDKIKDAIKEVLRDYLNVESLLSEAQKEIKTVKKQKDELEQVIIEFMKQNDLKVISVAGGKIKFNNKTLKKPIPKTKVMELIRDKVPDTIYDEVITLLEGEREEVNVQSIKLHKGA